MNYGGDISPKEAWAMLSENGTAAMVDVRTVAEWTFVGTPVLDSASQPLITLEWQTFPTMQIDPNFVPTLAGILERRGVGAESPVLFLCRSGVRSLHAAQAMTAAGYAQCLNVAGGFEGDANRNGHRGLINGWKADALPWRQG